MGARRLDEKEKQGIYTMHCLGEKKADIASRYGIAESTVYRIISEQRKKQEEKGNGMAARSKVVAGDKRNGRLMSTTDPHRFEGTCVVGGRKQSKVFTTVNAKKAIEMWEKWCQDLRDEQEFMDRIERKTDALVQEVAEQKEPEPQVVCGAPLDHIEEIRPVQAIEPAPVPEINVRPWKDVAEERQQRIEELEAKVAELEAKAKVADHVILNTEGDAPKLDHWFNKNGAFRVFWMNKPVYVLWAKTDVPKLYGVYRTMETALKEVDKLNEVAAFLGSEGVFEVEEVAWKA